MDQELHKDKQKDDKMALVGAWIVVLVVIFLVIGLMGGQKSSEIATSSQDQQMPTENSGSQEQSQQPPVSQQLPTTKPLYYPITFPANIEAYRASFLSGCNITGNMLNYCNCTFDFIVSNYGFPELVRINAIYNATGEISQSSRIAHQKCSTWVN